MRVAIGNVVFDAPAPSLDDYGVNTRSIAARYAELLLQDDVHRVYADPVGHPFCLYPGGDRTRGRIERVVFDCFSPRSLAAFYRAFTQAERTTTDTPEWVELAPGDGDGPSFGFRHVPHIAPAWPDPRRPQQLHIDYQFTGDSREFGEEVVRLGAMRLPYRGGGFVYADPAGHPFCLGE